MATPHAALQAGRTPRVDEAYDRAPDGLQGGGYNHHDRRSATVPNIRSEEATGSGAELNTNGLRK